MPFEIGQRVVCVDAKARNGYPSLLVEGAVYTIRQLYPEADGVLLEELLPLDGFWGWWVDRFRPFDERRLDVFRAMLAPAHNERQDDRTYVSEPETVD